MLLLSSDGDSQPGNPAQASHAPDQQSLQRSLKVLQQVIDSLPQAIYWKDEEDIFLGCNQAFAQQAGLSHPAEIVGKRAQDLPNVIAENRFLENRDRLVVEQSTPEQHLLELTDDSMQSTWLEIHKMPFQDLEQDLTGLVCTIQDVTLSTQADLQLKHSQEFLHHIINGLSDPIFVKDRAHRWVSMNDSFCAFVGRDRTELLNKSDYDFFPKTEADVFWEKDELVFTQIQTHENEECFTDQNGVVHTISTKKSAFTDTCGKQFLVGSIRDISERKQAEQALEQLAAELESRVEERTKALRESEARLQALLENLPVGCWTADRENRHLMQNSASMSQWGNLIGKHPQDLNLQPEVLHQWLESNSRALAGEVLQLENVYQRNNGKDWICSTILAPIRDGAEICGLLGVEIDITEQKRTEAALRENEEQLRLILQNMPVMMDAFDSDGNIIMWNSECERVTGFSAAEIIRNPKALELLYVDREYREQMLQEWALLGNNFRNWEWNIWCKDGSIKTILWSNLSEQFPVPGWAGWGVGIDISDRKRAEEQMREQAQREQLLNQLIRQIRQSLDFDTILETVLQEVQTFLGTECCHFAWYYLNQPQPYWEVIKEARQADAPSLLGRYPISAQGPLATRLVQLDVIRIEDTTTWSNYPILQFMQAAGYQTVLMLPMQTQTGAIGVMSCNYQWQAYPWDQNDIALLQAVMGQLAIALNQANLYTQTLSKAKELEHALQELQRTQSRMVQSEKMSSLGQLVAGVAHEINNPVNFIYGNLGYANDYTQDLLGLVKLYQQHYPNPVAAVQTEADAIDVEFLIQDLPKLLQSMKVGADRIQKIVASLRTFSRMDEAEMKAVNIHEGIDSTLMILQSRLKPKGDRSDIEVVKDYGEMPLVECYAGQLNQVFMNILANSIDALEEARESLKSGRDDASFSPIIRILTERATGDRIIIRISDNGPGIPDPVQQRLFDPFFTTKPVGKGTGMGLSISYQIVTERHGGTLECLSEPGQGTEFKIEIPISQSAQGEN